MGGKGRAVRKADNLPPSVSLDVSHPSGPSWPVTGIALFTAEDVITLQICHTHQIILSST
jgi:hypothetical protein